MSLKEAMEKRDTIEKAQEQLREAQAKQVVEQPFIEVTFKIIPDVLMRLGKGFKEFRVENGPIKLCGRAQEILEERDGAFLREDGTVLSMGATESKEQNSNEQRDKSKTEDPKKGKEP